MTLGERCDEIVRLIDETLSGLASDVDGASVRSLASEATESEFPDDELGRVLAYERLCEVGHSRPVAVAG